MGTRTQSVRLVNLEVVGLLIEGSIDVIFPAYPIFIYLFPKLGQYLLEPLFRYQASGQYPNKFVF